jgi:hypothetical protein
MEAEASSNGAVGPCDEALFTNELFAPRQPHAARLDFILWTLERSSDRCGRKLCTSDTRAFKHRLFLRLQPFQIAFDHLVDAAECVESMAAERLCPLSLTHLARVDTEPGADQEIIDHVNHEQRIAVSARVNNRGERAELPRTVCEVRASSPSTLRNSATQVAGIESLTIIPGHTASSSVALVTRRPGWSTK